MTPRAVLGHGPIGDDWLTDDELRERQELRQRRLAQQRHRPIGRYLKRTRTKGIILNPSKELKVDAYPDADFAGLWGYEDPNDATCVKSRTGFVICVSDCPVVWVSKLQTEIATSTLEAEYVALGQCCRSLFPLLRTVKCIAEAVG